MGTSIAKVSLMFNSRPHLTLFLAEQIDTSEENFPACLNIALMAIPVFYWYGFISTRNVCFLYGF